MKRGPIIKICALAVLLTLVLSVVRGTVYILLALFAVLIHELGHIAAARAFRVPFTRGAGSFAGLTLKFDFSSSSYMKEFAVCAAGALSNIAACGAAFALVRARGSYFAFFIFTNLSLALFNLLPISPLDGEGMLRSLFSLVVSDQTAERIGCAVSALFSLAFFVFCVYVQMKIGANLSLMFISVYLVYSTVKNFGVIKRAP